MTYIARGVGPGYLQIVAGVTAQFIGTSPAGAATVAFHLVDTVNKTFSRSPSANICGGKSYVLAVGIPGTTQSSALMLATPVPLGTITYILLTPDPNLSTQGLSIFIPASSTINLLTPFVSSIDGSSDTYILTSSPDITSVGYPAPLKNPLNNCSTCGCNTGSTCQTNGSCTTVCGADAACAGSCNGQCPTGSRCSLGSNGTYSCTEVASWWVWVGVAIVVLIMIIFFIFLFASLSAAPKPVAIAQPVAVANTVPVPNAVPKEYMITAMPAVPNTPNTMYGPYATSVPK